MQRRKVADPTQHYFSGCPGSDFSRGMFPSQLLLILKAAEKAVECQPGVSAGRNTQNRMKLIENDLCAIMTTCPLTVRVQLLSGTQLVTKCERSTGSRATGQRLSVRLSGSPGLVA